MLTLQQARCCKHGCGYHGRRPPSRKLWHIAGSKRRCWLPEKTRNFFYDNKPQRYAEDNRTAHLTARSDKSVAYVTNNKRLYSTFCTVEANYWQTRSIARLLCDSRATCSLSLTLVNAHFIWYMVTAATLAEFALSECSCWLFYIIFIRVSTDLTEQISRRFPGGIFKKNPGHVCIVSAWYVMYRMNYI